jgi:hypothetical protein
MRAIGWIILSLGVFVVFPDLYRDVGARNQDMGLAVYGVGFALFVFIWTAVLSQATFTRISHVLGYLLFNIGLAFTIFLTFGTGAFFLAAQLPKNNNEPVRIVIIGGVVVGAGLLLWMLVNFIRRKHADSFLWRVLETNRLVGAAPARIQEPLSYDDAPQEEYEFS